MKEKRSKIRTRGKLTFLRVYPRRTLVNKASEGLFTFLGQDCWSI